ncbi:MAG TPA: hypothetical protein VN032_12905 [Thermoanaerobaculia bacterium]|jgi:hypothetical protein|nr:hypothetical protein [Thermoanaerobaculia bacterium]
MQAESQAGAPAARARRFGPFLVIAAVLLVLWRAQPLGRAYLAKLAAGHATPSLVGAAAGAAALLAVLWLGLLRRPVLVAGGLAAFAGATSILSGNLGAVAIGGLLLAVTLSAGDLVSRGLRGVDAAAGDLTSVFGAGLVTVGLVVLLLGEAGVLSRGALAVALALPMILRPRRLRPLARLVGGSVRLPRGDAPRAVEAGWLAFAALVLVAVWVGALAPDVSWDGLAYHLPEARDVAAAGRVAALQDLAPQSMLWRNHDAYLALAFVFGGERVARMLQLAVGLAAFGAALALARRVGARGAGPLVVLALAAFPTAMLQLHATYVDWPAAFLVAAAAAELAAARRDPGRLRLAAFLFGGAVATKVFALAAAPALALLAWRARPRARVVAVACACGLAALAPWIAWSARRTGSIVAPYAASPAELVGRVETGHFFRTSPASGAAAAPESVQARLVRFARLPYDLVFHSSRFEGNGDGYNGVFVLVALAGLAGWDARRLALFAVAALPALIPWSLLYLPSIRYLFPLYPLYAVFVAEGLRQATSRFGGKAGTVAGLALLGAAAAFPVQLGSSGLEWTVATGRVSRDGYLAARLPAFAFRDRIGPDDRIVLFGENDRFHCPAAAAWRDDYLPVAAWGRDPAAWREGLDALGITAVLLREDRRGAGPLFGALADRLEAVARHGPAVLYRVRR